MSPYPKAGFAILWTVCVAASSTILQASVVESAEVGQTMATMGRLIQAMEAFNRKYGYFPPTTDNAKLMTMLTGVNRHQIKFFDPETRMFSDGIIRDGWKQPFTFEKKSSGLLIRSAGKDGRNNTKDDLIM